MEQEVKPRYLVMVTPANNNKYYKQIPHGDTWTAEYGRVGASEQTAEYPMSKWETKYREKIRKGYVDQSSLVEDLIEVEKPKNPSIYREIEDKAISEIVSRLQLMANRAIQDHYRISSNRVTQAMVDEAQQVLIELTALSSISSFNEMLIRLFTVIPRTMKEVSSYLSSSKSDFSEIIKREQDLLDVMKGQVVQKQIDEHTSSEVTDTKNSLTILEALGFELSQCDDSDIQIIKKALGSEKSKFYQAWRVKNHKTQARFDAFMKQEKIKETRLLWHGSRNENWWSILHTGLVLRPTNAVITGKMFGMGCYFAPKATKSLGYTSLHGSYWAGGYANSAFMALMDVAYGKPYDVYHFDSKYSNFDYKALQASCPNANCLHAHAGAMLRNDEIILYKEDQMTIKYLVELR